jgi:hypothetical protein
VKPKALRQASSTKQSRRIAPLLARLVRLQRHRGSGAPQSASRASELWPPPRASAPRATPSHALRRAGESTGGRGPLAVPLRACGRAAGRPGPLTAGADGWGGGGEAVRRRDEADAQWRTFALPHFFGWGGKGWHPRRLLRVEELQPTCMLLCRHACYCSEACGALRDKFEGQKYIFKVQGACGAPHNKFRGPEMHFQSSEAYMTHTGAYGAFNSFYSKEWSHEKMTARVHIASPLRSGAPLVRPPYSMLPSSHLLSAPALCRRWVATLLCSVTEAGSYGPQASPA